MAFGEAQRDTGTEGGVRLGVGVIVPAALLRFEHEAASSGPGGQNVNKRATAARLRVRLEDLPITPGARRRAQSLGKRWLVEDEAGGEFVIVSVEHRTQRRNREACLDRLREVVAEAIVPPKPRKKTRPSRGAVERRLQAKRERSDKKKRRREDPFG